MSSVASGRWRFRRWRIHASPRCRAIIADAIGAGVIYGFVRRGGLDKLTIVYRGASGFIFGRFGEASYFFITSGRV